MLSSRSDHGGGPKHIATLVTSLCRSHEFLVAAPEIGHYSDVFSRTSLARFDLPHRRFSFFALFRLCLFARRYKVDVIHSHGRGAGYYSRLVRMILPGVKVIHTHHGFYFQRLDGMKRFVLIQIEKFFSRFTDTYVFVSESESRAAASVGLYYPEKSHLISNGISVYPLLERKPPSGGKTIITVTRLEKEKGNDILLQVIAELSRARDDFSIRIVGDGPERQGLEMMAAELGILDHVEFLGVREDVPQLLVASDIFVSASLGEAQGIAIMEAMMHGVPVVASRVMGHIDIIEHERNGLLFDLDSVEDGAGCISRMIEDTGLWELIRSRGHQHASEKYSKETMANKIAALYRPE